MLCVALSSLLWPKSFGKTSSQAHAVTPGSIELEDPEAHTAAYGLDEAAGVDEANLISSSSSPSSSSASASSHASQSENATADPTCTSLSTTPISCIKHITTQATTSMSFEATKHFASSSSPPSSYSPSCCLFLPALCPTPSSVSRIAFRH